MYCKFGIFYSSTNLEKASPSPDLRVVLFKCHVETQQNIWRGGTEGVRILARSECWILLERMHIAAPLRDFYDSITPDRSKIASAASGNNPSSQNKSSRV